MRLARGSYRGRIVALASGGSKAAGTSAVGAATVETATTGAPTVAATPSSWTILSEPDGSPAEDPLLGVLRAAGGDPAYLAALITRDSATVSADEITLLAPLHRPGKIIAVGLNYADHTAETGMIAPARPLTFAKYPTSIVGAGDVIRVPRAITEQADWEAELALVIGRACGPFRAGTLADVAAYTVANDVSARDLQLSDQQWSRAKSIDTFCPLGPVLVTADEFGDPVGHRVWCTVNGETMQDASTDDMIFDVPTILSFLSSTMTLEVGDVILTGTPPGVGGFRTPPVFLADGDEVVVGVEGIGQLTNTVEWV